MNGSAVSGPDLRGTALVILFCFPMTSAAQAVERPRLVEELLTGERVTLQDEKELEASFGFDDRSLSALETLTLTLRLEYGISDRRSLRNRDEPRAMGAVSGSSSARPVGQSLGESRR